MQQTYMHCGSDKFSYTERCSIPGLLVAEIVIGTLVCYSSVIVGWIKFVQECDWYPQHSLFNFTNFFKQSENICSRHMYNNISIMLVDKLFWLSYDKLHKKQRFSYLDILFIRFAKNSTTNLFVSVY